MRRSSRVRAVAGSIAIAAALALPSASVASNVALHFNHVRIRVSRLSTSQAAWSSSNWSGYAKTGSGFSSATAQWKVPSVTGTRGSSYSSSWVGIDGFNNSSLIQTGTEQDYYNGSAHYGAWWEILPAAETPISSITVHPGDMMTASITKGSGSSWTIAIKDVTTGKTFSTVQSYSGPQTSVEWIQEAPTVGGRVATLAHYSTTAFDPGTVNGGNPSLTAADSGVMIQKRAQVSTPSNPDGDTDGFEMAYGATAPPPPAS